MAKDFEKIADAINKKLSKSDTGFQVTVLSDPQTLSRVEHYISTRCLPLDIITGFGIPIRRITEIYGDNATGKTLLATEAVIDIQNQGGFAVYADAEVALGVERMVELGVDPDRMIYADVESIGDVFGLLDASIEVKNEKFGVDVPMVFVWDSVASIATKDELEQKDYEARQYPTAARLISQALRKTPRKLATNNVAMVCINQTRQKLGVMFGDDEATYGGKALSFYSSLRIRLKTTKKLKSGKRIIGAEVEATVIKNRLAPPFRSVKLPIYYEYGVDEAMASFYFLDDRGLLTRNGSWYSFEAGDEEVKFQRKGFREVFDEHYEYLVGIMEDVFYDDEEIEDEE